VAARDLQVDIQIHTRLKSGIIAQIPFLSERAVSHRTNMTATVVSWLGVVSGSLFTRKDGWWSG
jgi:hypothetical protein